MGIFTIFYFNKYVIRFQGMPIDLSSLTLNMSVFQFWLGDQWGHSHSPALWARSIHHPGAHSLVAMGTFLCHGYHRHAAWGEWHPKLWPQQLQQARPRGVPSSAHCICRLLRWKGHRRARNPGNTPKCPSPLHCPAGFLICVGLSRKWFMPNSWETLWNHFIKCW